MNSLLFNRERHGRLESVSLLGDFSCASCVSWFSKISVEDRALCPTVLVGGEAADVGGKPRPTGSASVVSESIFGHGSWCPKIGEVTL